MPEQDFIFQKAFNQPLASVPWRRKIANVIQRWMGPDPGLLRAKHSIKTLCACGVSLVLFIEAPMPTVFVAVFSTFILMQAHAGNNRRSQMKTMLIAGAAMPVISCMGALSQGRFWLGFFLAATLAALVYKLRQFGPRFFLFPALGFVLYLLSTGIPATSPYVFYWYALSGVTAFAISFSVYFYVWPENRHRALIRNVEVFFQETADLLDVCGKYLHDVDEPVGIKDKLCRMLTKIQMTNQLSQVLLDSQMIRNSSIDNALHDIIRHDYDIVKSLRIFLYAMMHVSSDGKANPSLGEQQLRHSITVLAQAFRQLSLRPSDPVQTKGKPTMDVLTEEFDKLQEMILKDVSLFKEDTIPVFNMTFGLSEMNDNLKNILQLRQIVVAPVPEGERTRSKTEA